MTARFHGIGGDAPEAARMQRVWAAAELRALERELAEQAEIADLQARIAHLKSRLAQTAATPAVAPPRVDVPRARPPLSATAFRSIAPTTPTPAPSKRSNPLTAVFVRSKPTGR